VTDDIVDTAVASGSLIDSDRCAIAIAFKPKCLAIHSSRGQRRFALQVRAKHESPLQSLKLR
jgi:hypothetical protein